MLPKKFFWHQFIFCFFALGYAILKFAQAYSVGPAEVMSDSTVFFSMADASLDSATLWFGLRPFLVGLLYKLCHQNLMNVTLLQTGVSTFAWIVLGYSLKTLYRPLPLKLLVFSGTLLFSLSRNILMWDYLALSESISLSVSALLLSAAIHFYRTPRLTEMVLLSFTIVMWGAARETMSWLLLPMSALFLGSLLNRENRKSFCKIIVLAAFCLINFFFQNYSSNRGERWVFPLLNIISLRILPVPAASTFFADKGMPVSEKLMEQKGGTAYGNNKAYYQAPELEKFREWLKRDGKGTYQKYLLSHPSIFYIAPLEMSSRIVSPILQRYQVPNFKGLLSNRVERIIFPKTFSDNESKYLTHRNLAMIALFILPLIFGLLYLFGFGAFSWPLALLSLALPTAILVVLGDAMETERHALSLAVQIRLGLWLTLFSSLNWLFSLRLEHSQRSN